MREEFKRELEILNKMIIDMGNLIIENLNLSINALENRNTSLAKEIIERDEKVNNFERKIESKALELIIKEQPVASDLRFISVALKMITDMERIGDHSADIAEIVIDMEERELFKKPETIKKMVNEVMEMLNLSIKAFVKRDIKIAKKIKDRDIIINNYFKEIKEELIIYLKKEEGEEEQIINFLMIAKYLERIGDHIKNIVEWVYFLEEGKHLKTL